MAKTNPPEDRIAAVLGSWYKKIILPINNTSIVVMKKFQS
jgi:hypothetical protein